MSDRQSTVDVLGHLARLSLPEEERRRQEKDFRDVVAFVNAIEHVPATSLPFRSTVSGVRHVLREDVVTSSVLAEALLEAAPQRRGRFILVPAVL